MTAMRKGGPIGALDIGTSKVACMIVMPSVSGSGPVLAGFGHQRSRGIKAGVVVDLDAAEKAVRSAVAQAERMAGFRISDVVISAACGRQRSLHFAASAEVEAGVVSRGDLSRLENAACAFAGRDGRSLVQLVPLGFRLGGVGGIASPIGLAASNIDGDFHAVVGDDAPLRNLLMLVERCDLAAASVVPSAHAAALGVTSSEQRHAGVTCIDIGAGTTGMASYFEGKLINIEMLAVGGQHVTFDLARSLSAPLEEAERIKTLYGTLVEAPSDDQEPVSYELVGPEDPETYQVPRAFIRKIVQGRMAQLFHLMMERLASEPARRWMGQSVVLTGGASQMIGLSAVAERVLGRPVIVARPLESRGLSGSLCTPALATVIGLVNAVESSKDSPIRGMAQTDGRYVGRVTDWLRESF